MAAETPPPRPNIVLIMVDDMGFSDVGSYGGEIATPNLDKLARHGLRFTQFYNTGKCAPSRACAMTGLYSQQVGVNRRGSGDEKLQNSVTVAEVLRVAGYRTWLIGKWHGADNPYKRGFDHFHGLWGGAMNQFNPGLQRPGEPVPARKNPRTWVIDDKVFPAGRFTPEPGFYSTDWFTSEAIDLIRGNPADIRPFFLFLAYTAPHFPLHAPPEDIARYRGLYREGWEAYRQRRYVRQQQIGIVPNRETMALSSADIFGHGRNYEGNPSVRAWEELSGAQKDEWDMLMATYAAMVDRIDQQVGRLVATLTELGKLDSTLILFCSDNGANGEYMDLSHPGAPIGRVDSYRTVDRPWANVSNTPLRRFKHWSHEGGITTPLIVHWPAMIDADPDANGGSGRITEDVGHFIDFMPTFVEIAGATYPADHNGERVFPVEGRSLLPLLLTGKRQGHDALFWEYEGGMAVRQNDWKLVREYDGEWELYNLAVDRSETENLAAVHPDRRDSLERLFRAWAARPDVDLDFD